MARKGFNNPPGGPGKGPGNGSAPAKPFGSPDNDASAAGKLSGHVRRQMRDWRKEHPEWENKSSLPSTKQIRDYVMGLAPDAVDVLGNILHDAAHPKQAEVALALLQHAIGRPAQAVELSGKDGAPIEIEALSDRALAERLVLLGAQVGLPVTIEGDFEELHGA